MASKNPGDYQTLPLLPLRDVVIFPGMMMPFVVGRGRSVAALERAMESGKRLFLSAQRDPDVEDPDTEDVYPLGTISTIVQSLKRPDGTVKVLVEGVRRASLVEETDQDEFLEVVVSPIDDADDTDLAPKTRQLTRLFEKYVKLSLEPAQRGRLGGRQEGPRRPGSPTRSRPTCRSTCRPSRRSSRSPMSRSASIS